jgi:hypothetical protein
MWKNAEEHFKIYIILASQAKKPSTKFQRKNWWIHNFLTLKEKFSEQNR